MSTSTGPSGNPNHDTLAGMLLGKSRIALSGHFYEMADVYFHKGIEHIGEVAFEQEDFQRMAGIVSPKSHIHSRGQEVTEIMPWLWIAIRSNPQDVDIVRVAAFWLMTDCGRPNLAERVLREAQWSNPFDYRPQLDLGRLFLKRGETRKAAVALDAGLAFLSANPPSNEEDAKFDRSALLLYRGLLYEANGEYAAAAAALKGIMAIFPERTYLMSRISDLESGEAPKNAPQHVWTRLIDQEQRQKTEMFDGGSARPSVP